MDWGQCSAVDRNPHKLAGKWCFSGTRLPVTTLFDYLERGSTVDEFLEAFPVVSREQVHKVLVFAQLSLEQPAPAA